MAAATVQLAVVLHRQQGFTFAANIDQEAGAAHLAGYVALFTLNSIAMHGPSPWSFLSLVLWQCGITLSPLLSPLNTGSYTKDLYMGHTPSLAWWFLIWHSVLTSFSSYCCCCMGLELFYIRGT